MVDGKEQAFLTRYTHVYVKQHGQWRMVAMQNTNLTAPPASALPPGVTTKSPCTFEVTDLPAEFEVVRSVLDTQAGVFAPYHTHGGNVYITVLAGEWTWRSAGIETKYPTGACVVELPSQAHSGGNAGQGTLRLQNTTLLPKGKKLTTFQDPGAQRPPGQSYFAQVAFRGTPMAGPLQLYQSLIEFAPGASIPTHTHPGPGYTIVLEGQITRQVFGATSSVKIYNPGESYVENPNEPHSVANTALGTTVIAGTFLLPKGAAPITITGQ
jgi:quercetin dioxygenase-like cupin family protein